MRASVSSFKPGRITPAHAGKILKRPKNMIAHGLTNVNKEETMNKVILIGNLTRDPETHTTQSGATYCVFTLAVNRRKHADGTQEADFFSVTAWRQLGELCQKYLAKGRKACVEGSIQMRTYEGQDGVKRLAVDIIADSVEFLSSSSQAAQTPPPPEAPAFSAQNGFTVVDNDELPF